MAIGMDSVEILIDSKAVDAEVLRITRTINEHSRILIMAKVKLEAQKYYLEMMAKQTPIEVNITEIVEVVVTSKTPGQPPKKEKKSRKRALFLGMVNDMKFKVINGIAQIEVHGVSYTYQLDIVPRTRTFQDGAMKYSQVIAKVAGGNDKFKFSTENKDNKIGHLIVQYNETDWEFLQRMASRFRDPLVVHDDVTKPYFTFGINKAKTATGKLEGRLYTFSRDSRAYDEYCNAARRYQVKKDTVTEKDYTRFYLRDEADELEIGDQLTLGNDQKLYVYKTVLKSVAGIIRYEYELMSELGLKQKRRVNPKLAGVSLRANVIEVKQDKVKVDFKFEDAPEVSKAWSFPFATFYSAEANTGWYAMPEKGEEVRVYFPVANDEKAYVTNVIHESGTDRTESDRYFVTAAGQKLVMNPEGVHFVTQHGKDEKNGAGLAIRVCQNGVSIYSEKDIQLASSGSLELRSDQRLTMNAGETMEFVCKASNLKLDGLIWRKSTKVHENHTLGLGNSNQRQREEEKRNHAASPTPTPVASSEPKIEEKKEDKQEEKEDKKYYLGADGKKNYLDASRLYRCELNAYNDPKFEPRGGDTFCNLFVESVLSQYAGTNEYKGKRCVDIYAYLKSSPKWKLCNAISAQQYAKEGYFVVGITTVTMSGASLPNHIAVICPEGKAFNRQGIICPSIAQQGKSKIIYGKTVNYTANYGWSGALVGYIKYYYKIPDGKLK